MYLTANTYMKNDVHKRFLERSACTHKIVTKRGEFVWVVYRPMLSQEIKGLYLYNITTQQGETEPLLIDDMLKLFVAYQALCNETFLPKLKRLIAQYEGYLKEIDDRLDKSEVELERIKISVPQFVYQQWARLIANMRSVQDDESPALELLKHYAATMEQVSHEREIAAKTLLGFHRDLYQYHQQVRSVEEVQTSHLPAFKDALDYLVVLSSQETFLEIAKIGERQMAHMKALQDYSEFSIIKEIVAGDFSDSVIAPYKNLIRNPK